MSELRRERPCSHRQEADDLPNPGQDQEDRVRQQKLEFARSKLAGPNGVSDKLRNVSARRENVKLLFARD
jgi:hypothetical protein